MSCTVTFRIYMAATQWGETIGIVGNTNKLSSWGKTTPTSLSPSPYPFWTITLSLPANIAVEYKYVVIKDGKVIQWESLPSSINRKLKTGDPDSVLKVDGGNFGDPSKTIIEKKEDEIEPQIISSCINTTEQDMGNINNEHKLIDESQIDEEESSITFENPSISLSSMKNDEDESCISEQNSETEIDISTPITKTGEVEFLSTELDASRERVEELRTVVQSLRGWNSMYESGEWSSEGMIIEKDEKKGKTEGWGHETNSDSWSDGSMKVNVQIIEGINDENDMNLLTKAESYVDCAIEDVERMAVKLRTARQARAGRKPMKGAAAAGTLLVVAASGMMLVAALLALNADQWTVYVVNGVRQWTMRKIKAVGNGICNGWRRGLRSVRTLGRLIGI